MTHFEHPSHDYEDLDEHLPPRLTEELESDHQRTASRKSIAAPFRRRIFNSRRNNTIDDTKEIVKLIKDFNGKPKEMVEAEAQSELERTKLTVWLVKAVVLFMGLITFFVITAVVYSASNNVNIVLPSFLSDSLGVFKDIAITIMETK